MATTRFLKTAVMVFSLVLPGGSFAAPHPTHTHTSPAHTHTPPEHTHTRLAHTGTSAAHTHTSPAHTLTSPRLAHPGHARHVHDEDDDGDQLNDIDGDQE